MTKRQYRGWMHTENIAPDWKGNINTLRIFTPSTQVNLIFGFNKFSSGNHLKEDKQNLEKNTVQTILLNYLKNIVIHVIGTCVQGSSSHVGHSI